MGSNYEPSQVTAEEFRTFRKGSGLSMQDARVALERNHEADAMIRLMRECDTTEAERWLLMRHAEREGYASRVREALAACKDSPNSCE